MSGLTSPLALWALCGAAVLLQVAFMLYLGERAYPDVFRAVAHGYRLAESGLDAGVINSKTNVGPRLWFAVHTMGGLTALRWLNVGLLLAMIAVVHRLATARFDRSVVTLGLFMVLFYPGTHRNVVAGEQDDMVAALSVVVGVLLWVLGSDRGRKRISPGIATATAGLAFGVGLLFKYWVGPFAAGFLLVLGLRGGWRNAGIFGMAVLIPFGLLNLADGFESLSSLFLSFRIQAGYSPWSQVAAKSLNTGLVPFFAMALWSWWRSGRAHDRMSFLLIPVPYVFYVVLARDAFAMSYVMMLCVCFWGMLVADAIVGELRRGRRPLAKIVVLMTLYVAGTTAITYKNFFEDTRSPDLFEVGPTTQ